MYSSKTSLSMLSRMLRDWADAIDAGDVQKANKLAEHLPRAAELITAHPEFKRHFEKACPELKSETVLEYMSRLLLSATKAKSEPAQQFYSDKSEQRRHASDTEQSEH